MGNKNDIPERLYDDEAVRFIAGRYHTTPQNAVQCFLAQVGIAPEQREECSAFRLEDNEMELIRGLIRVYRA